VSGARVDLRARAIAEAERLFGRWHPGERLEIESGDSRHQTGSSGLATVETPIAAWRTIEAELRFGIDADTRAVVWFEDPEGRAGAPAAEAPKVGAERADELVDAARVLMVGARLASAKLEPVRPGEGVLWRLEYARGGPPSLRVEVHPATGAIVGLFRLGHPLVEARLREAPA
jgi:hypothetical protein